MRHFFNILLVLVSISMVRGGDYFQMSELQTTTNNSSKNYTIIWLAIAIVGSILVNVISIVEDSLQFDLHTTFISLIAFFIGMFCGWRLGTAVVCLFLVLGWHGFLSLPATLLGPQGGYLIGLIPAVAVSAYLVEKGWGKSIIKVFIAGLIGTIILHLWGLISLVVYVGLKGLKHFDIEPFFVGHTIKLFILSVAIPQLWQYRVYFQQTMMFSDG